MFLDNADPVLPYLHHAENIVFAYENKNVATFKCITFFCSEVLVCKNNDLRALLAVNEHHMSSNLTFKTLVAFTRVEISER